MDSKGHTWQTEQLERLMTEVAGARGCVRKTVEDHLQVIVAVDRRAQDWTDSAAFTTLHRLAARANAAC